MKRVVPVVALLVLGATAMGCSNAKLIAEKDGQITDLQNEVASLEGRVAEEQERVAQLNADLEEALGDQRQAEEVWLQERNGLTHITLDGEVTFSSGSSRLTAKGKDLLNRIWEVMANYPDRDILIEGHTDSVPIAERFRERFPSNWELSSARAHKVLHYVEKQFGVSPDRIAAVGYGKYRPIADNDTEEGRSRNRRVVITVGSKLPGAKRLP